MKIKIEIKNRFTGKVIFEFETEGNTIAKTVSEYLRQGNRDLIGADLIGADLSRANLSYANLSYADLRGANLSYADLSDANLSRANLSDANLSGADLSRANLSDANLSRIKYDFFGRMLMQKHEVPALRDKLINGYINGSCYEGECCCFVGTIAKVKGEQYGNLPLKPDAGSATERWFLGIRPGDTPENSQIVKITVDWIDEFLGLIN